MHSWPWQPRNNCGNLMLIIIMISALIIVAMLIIFTVHFVFFAQKRIQTESDELALRVANKLNEHDNAGFMNNLTMYSRESVFNARTSYNAIKTSSAKLEPLAQQLLDEARAGANLVCDERKLLVAHTADAIRKDVEENERTAKAAVTLPWASYSPPKITNIDLGWIKDVESNVEPPTGNQALLENDKAAGFIAPTNFYKANHDLPLPGADADLEFKLSSLPAPVKSTPSPARLASPIAFVQTFRLMNDGRFVAPAGDIMPSAARLQLVSTVKVSMGKDTEDTARVYATGVSCGAGPPP